jgi:hypothetical protein
MNQQNKMKIAFDLEGIMYKKEFIRDDGKIRNCDSNIAKMNILEFVLFKKFFIKDFWYSTKECLGEIGEGLKAVYWLFVGIFLMILFPIGFPLLAYFRIRNAKREVERCKRIWGKDY